MSNRDTSIDPRLLESARKESMEKGFIKAELKTICDVCVTSSSALKIVNNIDNDKILFYPGLQPWRMGGEAGSAKNVQVRSRGMPNPS